MARFTWDDHGVHMPSTRPNLLPFSQSNAESYFPSRVIFKNTYITAPLNKAIWSVWNTGDERTSNILFAEYNSTGSGVSGASRPSFATTLSASQANSYTISSAVGGDYVNWVDAAYIV